ELRYISRDRADDRFPHEAEEQAHCERLADQDRDEEEYRTVRGAADQGRNEKSAEDVQVRRERRALVGLCDSVREDDRRNEEDQDCDEIADVFVQYHRGL